MSAFSSKDFDADHYFASRPSYPDEFYKFLRAYHKGGNELLVDIGCGPGIATFQLARHFPDFKRIIGTDISETMIIDAKQLNRGQRNNNNNLEFKVASYNDFSFLNDNEKCDMITAVECVHWFNFDCFQENVAKNLKKGGTLAIWGYVDPVFNDYPDINKLNYDLLYGDTQLGPYWEQPGRTKLCDMLKHSHFNQDWFDEIDEDYVIAANLPKQDTTSKHPLLIELTMTLTTYLAYLKSCSAYHSWSHDPNNNNKRNIVDQFISNILVLHPELSIDTPVQITWNSFYKCCKRHY